MTGDVLIVGGGISGLTAATALARKGINTVLVERKAALADEGGVGLALLANAMRALDDIGVAGRCLAAGVPADSMLMCAPDGAPRFENPIARIEGQRWPGATSISRAAFHAILAEAAQGAGVDIRCGLTVADWQEHDDSLRVTFSDGSAGRFALMVGADGLYSGTRAKLFPECQPLQTGQAAWRGACERPADLDRMHLVFGGRHGAVGINPVSPTLAYLYIVENAAPGTRRDPATLHTQMREELADYGGLVATLAATLDDPAKINYRPLEWLLAPAPWSKGRVALIGDAAHANPPVLAQGAAMGIEDAIVLAEEVASGDPVDVALARFADRRYDRVKYIVETSCQLAQWEVDHTAGVDVPAIMRAASTRLAEPI